MIPHGSPNPCHARTRVHFCARGRTAIVRPRWADNCHSKASATQRMSLTKENVVNSLFWVLAGEQLSKPGSQKARSRNYQRRGLRLRRALSGRTGRGRIPETALSITSFRRIRGSLPKRRTLVLGLAGSCACKFVGRDVGVLVAASGLRPRLYAVTCFSQVVLIKQTPVSGAIRLIPELPERLAKAASACAKKHLRLRRELLLLLPANHRM